MWTIIYSTLEAPQCSTEQDSTAMNESMPNFDGTHLLATSHKITL